MNKLIFLIIGLALVGALPQRKRPNLRSRNHNCQDGGGSSSVDRSKINSEVDKGGDVDVETGPDGEDTVESFYYLYNTEQEPMVRHAETRIIPGKVRIHKNVIVIKVPPSEVNAPADIDLPETVRERNIIYVLVKKPKEIDPIVITTEKYVKEQPEIIVVKYKDEFDNDDGTSAISDSIIYSNKARTETDINSAVAKLVNSAKIDLPKVYPENDEDYEDSKEANGDQRNRKVTVFQSAKTDDRNAPAGDYEDDIEEDSEEGSLDDGNISPSLVRNP